MVDVSSIFSLYEEVVLSQPLEDLCNVVTMFLGISGVNENGVNIH